MARAGKLTRALLFARGRRHRDGSNARRAGRGIGGAADKGPCAQKRHERYIAIWLSVQANVEGADAVHAVGVGGVNNGAADLGRKRADAAFQMRRQIERARFHRIGRKTMNIGLHGFPVPKRVRQSAVAAAGANELMEVRVTP